MSLWSIVYLLTYKYIGIIILNNKPLTDFHEFVWRNPWDARDRNNISDRERIFVFGLGPKICLYKRRHNFQRHAGVFRVDNNHSKTPITRRIQILYFIPIRWNLRWNPFQILNRWDFWVDRGSSSTVVFAPIRTIVINRLFEDRPARWSSFRRESEIFLERSDVTQRLKASPTDKR